MSRFRLIALDLDGTTLTSDHVLTKYTKDTLHAVKEKYNGGLIIVIATGRSVKSVRHVVQELGILKSKEDVLYCVCNNGSYGVAFTLNQHNQHAVIVAQTQSDNVNSRPSDSPHAQLVETEIFCTSIPHQHVQRLVDFAKPRNLLVQYYPGKSGEVIAIPSSSDQENLLKQYELLVGHPQNRVQSYDDAYKHGPPGKMILLTNEPDQLIQECQKELGTETFDMIRGSPTPFFVEFLQKGVNKGTGLQKLCTQLGVDMTHVVAFGDGFNDMEMLQKVGCGVAMKNANQDLKAIADVVLEWTNDDEGVARHIERLDSQGMLGQ